MYVVNIWIIVGTRKHNKYCVSRSRNEGGSIVVNINAIDALERYGPVRLPTFIKQRGPERCVADTAGCARQKWWPIGEMESVRRPASDNVYCGLIGQQKMLSHTFAARRTNPLSRPADEGEKAV